MFGLGADVFIIGKMPGVVTDIDTYLEGQRRKDLTMDDYRAVSEGCKQCSYVGASITNSSGHVRYENQASSDTMVRGMTASMMTIYDEEIVAGRGITENDVENSSHVAVIGQDILENLMGGSIDPLEKFIRIDGQEYRVIGMGKKEGKTLGQSRDNYVLIPITAYMKQYGEHQSVRLSGKAAGVGSQLQTAMDEARVILRSRRHDQPGKPDTFAIDTNDSFLSIWSSISQQLLHRHDRHCEHFARGWRYRHHEHHAGVGHRTYARDWNSQSARRQAKRRDAAVLDRVEHDGRGRRRVGNCSGALSWPRPSLV